MRAVFNVILILSLTCVIAGGAEIPVNTYTTNSQANPVSCLDGSGGFVVSWNSNLQDGNAHGIFSQRFSPSSSKVGVEFQVNSVTLQNQINPAIGCDSNGRFTVVYEGRDNYQNINDVFLQNYDSNGNKVGSETDIATTGTKYRSYIRICRNWSTSNGFVVVWPRDTGVGLERDIRARRFNSVGTAVGNDFKVNTTAAGTRATADVCCRPDGSFHVVWMSGSSSENLDILGQRYNSNGDKVGSEFTIQSGGVLEGSRNLLACNTDGDFVVVWNDYAESVYYGGEFKTFNSSGTAVHGPTDFVTHTEANYYPDIPSVAFKEGSEFVIVWQSYDTDTSTYSVQNRSWDLNGNEIGSQGETTSNGADPQIGSNRDKSYVIAWHRFVGGAAQNDVFAQANIDGQAAVSTSTPTPKLRLRRFRQGPFLIGWLFQLWSQVLGESTAYGYQD